MNKAVIFIIVLLSGMALNAQDQNIDSLFAEANNQYSAQNYLKAIDDYEQIVALGYKSFELYFNLGNAYFKATNYPKAILFYERANLINPGNDDVKFNLQKANAYTIDRIEMIPEFFLISWFQNSVAGISSNTWAIISLVLILSFLLLVVLFFISRDRTSRIAYFTIGLILLGISITSYSFALKTKNLIKNSNQAIVMASTITVKGSPDVDGINVFIIHEGTKVRILRTIGDWSEIRIADGKQGWVQSTEYEKI